MRAITPEQEAFLKRFQTSVDATMRQLDLCHINSEILSARMRETSRIMSGISQELHAVALQEAVQAPV